MKGKIYLIGVSIVTLLYSLGVLHSDVSSWGRPSFRAGSSLGYYIWQDTDGWHIRWTTGGRKHIFRGKIKTDGEFIKARPIRTERGDFIVREINTIGFDMETKGGVDGIDFKTTGETVTFNIFIDGVHRPALVRIGAFKNNPERIPFTLFTSPVIPSIEERPQDIVRGPMGYYIWRDGNIWHIRWTTKLLKRKFTGRVRTDGRFYGVTGVRLETKDLLVMTPQAISFSTFAMGGVDGFDFKCDGTFVTFILKIDGEKKRERVYLGKNMHSPAGIPFTLLNR